MSAAKLTPWFPARVKPARKGVYEAFDGQLKLCFYCYWDGRQWYFGSGEFSLSDPDYRRWKVSPWRDSGSALRRWRGLANPPKDQS